MVEPFNQNYPFTDSGEKCSREFFQWLTTLVNSTGGFTEVGRQDMTGLGSTTITGIPSSATEIRLIMDNVVGSAGASTPAFRFGLGTTPTEYGYLSKVGTVAGTLQNQVNGVYFTGGGLGAGRVIMVMDFLKTGDNWVMSGAWSGGSTSDSVTMSCQFNSGSSSIDRVQLLLGSGTFASGEFIVQAK